MQTQQQPQQLVEQLRNLQLEVQADLQARGFDEASARHQVQNVYSSLENVFLRIQQAKKK